MNHLSQERLIAEGMSDPELSEDCVDLSHQHLEQYLECYIRHLHTSTSSLSSWDRGRSHGFTPAGRETGRDSAIPCR